MPVPPELLKKDFIVVKPTALIGDVLHQILPKGMWTYVVVSLENGKYAVVKGREILRALKKREDEFKGATEPAELLDLFANPISSLDLTECEAIDETTTTRAESRRLLRAAPNMRLPVLARDTLVGVLEQSSRSVSDSELLDIFWNKRVREAGKIQRPASLPEEPVEERWINAEILDHEPNVPLQVGQLYTLAFEIDKEVRLASVAKGAAFTYQFAADEESVQLTVQLSSPDFIIHTEPQRLQVPRRGRSMNKAMFDVEPKHEGEGVLSAVFLKDGNFIQLLTLKLNVGLRQPIESESLSRPLESSFAVQPRDLGLVITSTGTNFRLIITGSVCAEATLPLTTAELDQMISRTREALRQLVNLKIGTKKTPVYQSLIDIPEEVNRGALKHLAECGFLLYQQVFFGDAADAQTRLLGERLAELSARQPLKIQIVSQQFLLPWGLLYLAPDFDAENIDPERFLGFKHIIEHLPLQPSMEVMDSVISSSPRLTVGLNLDWEIDKATNQPLIDDQVNYWQEVARRSSTEFLVRGGGAAIEAALANPEKAEQLVYFYCHAVSKGLNEGGGPDMSCLQFPGGQLTLKDLKLRAPTKKRFPAAPLVFINACESAELSPLFYGGFVPYFMAKGARGVIGTECEIPALFARHWACRFFDLFLNGKPLGAVFLELRREFLYQHNNALGLLYAVYCDGDTRIFPAV